LAAFGEDFEQAVTRNSFATLDLGHALFQAGVEGRLAHLKPFLFGLVERSGDDLCG
jgi:hypothetical protein